MQTALLELYDERFAGFANLAITQIALDWIKFSHERFHTLP